MDRELLNELSHTIIGSAIKVHSAIGPGLLESVYRTCLLRELTGSGLNVVAEQIIPVIYKGELLEAGYRLDLIVEDQIIVEVKSIEKEAPVHRAQLLSYLRLTGKPLGLLINFNVPRLVQGVTRLINGY